jgi:hypothetical protein
MKGFTLSSYYRYMEQILALMMNINDTIGVSQCNMTLHKCFKLLTTF